MKKFTAKAHDWRACYKIYKQKNDNLRQSKNKDIGRKGDYGKRKRD